MVFTHETFTHKSFYTEKSLHRGAFTRSNKLKLAAVLREKPLAGAFGNSLAPQKSRLFPTKFLFHERFSKNIRNIFLKQVPIQKLSSPHCDEMEGREIRRSRRGASALKIFVSIHFISLMEWRTVCQSYENHWPMWIFAGKHPVLQAIGD